MASFAKVNNQNIVEDIIVVSDSELDNNGEFPESEKSGQEFLEKINLSQEGFRWLQTSYTNKFRKQYAFIGYSYNQDLDMFIKPQPFPSWSLKEDGEWYAPKEFPGDGKDYTWDEDKQEWFLSKIQPKK